MKFPIALLFVLLCVLPACDKTAKEKSRREAVDEIQTVSNAMKEEALKDIENGGMGVDKKFDYSGINNALDKAEGLSEGQEKIAIRLSKIYVAKFSEISEKLTDAGSDLAEGIDYSKAATEVDLNALSSKIRDYRRVNTEVKDKINMGIIENLEREADKMGLKGKDKADYFAEITGQFSRQMPVIHEIRDLDDRLCAEILKQHDVLRNHIGKWVWSAEAENLEFNSDEALEAFNELAVEIQKIAEDQAAAQRELISIK